MAKKSEKIRRIAITGPESTGKSSLAAELAAHYNTTWVPEFAREYLETLDRPYEEEDLVKIAKGQRKSEKRKLDDANRLLFCDTEMLVIKIWSMHKYNRVDEKILRWIDKMKYDFFLLCYPDLQWVHDPMRENPDKSHYFFKLFESEIKALRIPYSVVKGKGNERVDGAIEALDNFFK